MKPQPLPAWLIGFVSKKDWREAQVGRKPATRNRRATKRVGSDAVVRLPRRPWVASQQYSMRFILSQDNEIIIRADHLPIEVLRAMAEGANTWQPKRLR